MGFSQLACSAISWILHPGNFPLSLINRFSCRQILSTIKGRKNQPLDLQLYLPIKEPVFSVKVSPQIRFLPLSPSDSTQLNFSLFLRANQRN